MTHKIICRVVLPIMIAANLCSGKVSADTRTTVDLSSGGDMPELGRDVVNTAAGCTTLALPATIDAPGKYCLTSSHSVRETAITVNADDVHIDLQGHAILGPYDPAAAVYGIVSFGHNHISVANGALRGFSYGLYLSDNIDRMRSENKPFPGGWHLIENLTVDHNYFRGIRAEGNNNVIRNNIIRNTGGSMQYENAYAIAIENYGQAAIIEGNTILGVRGSGTTDGGEGVGISVSARGRGTIVHHNTVANDAVEHDTIYHWPATSRSSYGIWIGGDDGGEVIITDNMVANFVFGITFKRTMGGLASGNVITGALVPIYLPTVSGEWHAKARDNICDLDPLELLRGRRTTGCVEKWEDNYLQRWSD